MESEHPGVFIEEVAVSGRAIEAAPTSTTAFVGSFPAGPIGVPIDVHSVAHFKQLYDAPGLTTEASIAVHDFFANGGRTAVIVAAATGATRSTPGELVRALSVLSAPAGGAPHAQLLCIPDLARRVQPLEHHQYVDVLLRATGFCMQHRMFLIVDPNCEGDQVSDIERWVHTNPSWGSTNSAVYFPRLHTPAGRAAGDEPVAASGAVAGVMARTDAQRGVWKAPAGHEASIGAMVATPVSDTEQSPLNRNAVNMIRQFDRVGTVIWGARTGSGTVASDYRYVPVRRTALFIEHSVYRGLQWAVFEPNGEALWASIEQSVAHFMSQLWRAGAFVGSTPDEAFHVRCDETTMSRADRRRGRTVLEVGFAPLRPAEFVNLSIGINRPTAS